MRRNPASLPFRLILIQTMLGVQGLTQGRQLKDNFPFVLTRRTVPAGQETAPLQIQSVCEGSQGDSYKRYDLWFGFPVQTH